MANLGNEEKQEHITSTSHTTSSEDIVLDQAVSISTEKKSETPEISSGEKHLKGERVSLDKADKVDGGIAGGGDDSYEYIFGYKVFVVMAAITLTTFLALLDTTIVATVSNFS